MKFKRGRGRMSTVKKVHLYLGTQAEKIDESQSEEFLRRAQEIGQRLREDISVPNITLPGGKEVPGDVPTSTELTPRAEEAFSSFKQWCESL